MPGDHASAELLAAMGSMLTHVRDVSLRLNAEGRDDALITQRHVVDQLSDHVLPRLVQLDAPLLVVVGGSTGAGKSTLVNSLIGERVTESGVLRPTTRSPVLVHHPADAEWFVPDRILPDLTRTTREGNDSYALRIAASRRVPKGLAILDAPDVDSIDEGNRELASQLLAAADLWLFVTSAARYADQVPWDYLRQAAGRSASVAVVLDRTSDDAVVEVRGHLARMMTSRGLSDSPLFTVPESALDADGLLPEAAVAPITGWLSELSADQGAREMVVTRTLDGAVRHLVMRTHDVADALDVQIELARGLHEQADSIYRNAMDVFASQTSDGTLLRGEVLASWQEFVGTGELLKSVEDKSGRMRDRLVDGMTGKRTRSNEVADAIESSVRLLLVEQAESSAELTARAWAKSDSGRELMDQHLELHRASGDLRERAEQAVSQWHESVLELVRVEGADKRMTARFLAFGVNGIAVALMIVMLSRCTEDAGSHHPAALGEKLLDAIFGAEHVAALLEQAHADLQDRADALLGDELSRFGELIGSIDSLTERRTALRDAARQAENARHADFLKGEETS